MRKKFFLFIALIGIVFTLFIIKLPLDTYREDILYSNKVVSNSETEDIENEKYITREEAVNKLITVFDKGFGININREELIESINLYEVNGNLQWSILWMSKQDSNYGERYYCEVVAENGLIKYMGQEKVYELQDTPEYNGESIEEAFNIIKPLVEQLKIPVEQCEVYFEKFELDSRVVLKDSSEEVKHYFKVNYKDKIVQTYYRDN